MVTIRPFRALRPLPGRVAEIAAVPYDVVNTEEARALAAGNRFSFLHVSRPEIDLPEGTDIYSDQVYAKAAENFDWLIEQAPLLVEDEPSFYLYCLRMGNHQQTGLVACCSVDEYDNDTIRKHERTRRDKEDDRTRHILTLRAQTGPVFLIYRAQQQIDKLVSELCQSAPLFDFTAPDSITHTVWRVPPEANQKFIEAFAQLPALYIADGHHRAKSASRARQVLRAQDAQPSEEKEYNFFQCVIFPDNQVQILPYNRIVTELNQLSPEEFMHSLERDFEISQDASPAPSQREHFSIYLGGRWYGLRLKDEVTKKIGVVDRLDVTILQEKLLAPILGIQDVRTDKRIDFVGGIRGTKELERLVNEGRATVAFSLFPTTVEDLLAVADAGEVMPPKSTWFEPKLRDGILSHLI